MIWPFCAPLRELAFPGERVSDNGRKIVDARLPAERRPRPLRVGNDPRRIALAPRPDLDLEINAEMRLTVSTTSSTENPWPQPQFSVSDGAPDRK